ncbi:MAG: hypothetical protein B6D59_07815 [Campylobacteraceae bacterium 4484_4]|nr:MAG: hypothetical protein B6D59_07815 [Campylobacteraceae bacterium 4484_4]
MIGYGKGADMKRRAFIMLGAAVSATGFSFFGFGKREDPWGVIEAVQNHLFPKSGEFPSAEMFGATRYLKMNISHPTFDPDDREFLPEGAKRLEREYGFLKRSSAEREKVLQRWKESVYGERWLATLVYYSLEAMLADPIYGGNRLESGWRSLHHRPGEPRPRQRYGKYHG